MTNSTDRTGWAEADIPMNWSEEHPAEEGEWTECNAPNGSDDSLDLNDDKIREAEEDAAHVAEMCGF